MLAEVIGLEILKIQSGVLILFLIKMSVVRTSLFIYFLKQWLHYFNPENVWIVRIEKSRSVFTKVNWGVPGRMPAQGLS